MSVRRLHLHVVVAVVCALTVAFAAPVRANAGDGSKIVFSVENLTFASCPGSLFALSFEMVSPDGSPLGTGLSCVQAVDGCQFVAGCEDLVTTTFILQFAHGVLTVPMELRDTFPTDTSFVQRGKGKISEGSGDFAGARGHIKGGGTGGFVGEELVTDIVYVVHLNHGDSD